jgi:hypothetical protein
MRNFFLALVLAILVGLPVFADEAASNPPKPFVCPLFSDNMVLQRDQKDAIWGWSKPGDAITVTIGGQGVSVIADGDGKWLAKIAGNDVVVSSPQAAMPVAVRYDWAKNPQGNLFNQADLPALPFRTDDWPLITQNNK